MNNWKKLSSKTVYRNPYFRVREDKVIRPGGKKGTYYIIEQSNSVMIVPLNKDNEVYLVGLFRYTTQMFSWEVPGGAMEDKNIIGNAKKELLEETGLVSNNWQDLGIYEAMNGSVNKIGHILVAKNVTQTGSNKQQEEGILEMKKIPFVKVIEMIKKNQITDSHTISALILTGLRLDLIDSKA